MSIRQRFGRGLLLLISVSALLFMCLPILVVLPMSFSAAESLEFPPPGFSFRWYEAFFNDSRWLEALRTSFLVALLSSVAALILGGLASYGLVRGKFLGRRGHELNFAAPMVLPHIVTSIALYIAFARAGVLGTMTGLVLGHIVVASPFVVLVMSVGIAGFDQRIEQVALTLGASWHAMFRRILIPNIAPSLLAAWTFAFITSFDEITVTIFLAGPIDTVPKRMFTQLLERVDPTITAIASLLIMVSIFSVALVAFLMKPSRLLTKSHSNTGSQ